MSKKFFFMTIATLALLALLVTSCAPAQPSTPTPTPTPTIVPSPTTTTPPSPTPTPKFRVAFIYIGPIGDGGWTFEHEQGRLMLLQNVPGIEAKYIESVPEGADSTKVIRDYAQQGFNVIITTSFGYMDPTIEVAKDFPNTVFLHCSGYKTAANVGTYFGKIEEPRYLSGMAAGKMTKTNKLGYVAAFPIPEVIRGINAFTLGVRAVNPAATVNVVWTNTWYDPAKERQAAEGLLDTGCDVIAQHQDTPGPQQAAEAAGKYGVGYDSDMAKFAPKAVITCPVWNWGTYYVDAVKKIMAGAWTTNQYWGGMKDGMVSLTPLANFVPADVKALVEAKKAEIMAGTFDIFSIFAGPLNDQTGAVKVAAGVKMTGDEILNMMWFVEGVNGQIPSGG
ncbi:MAG: BMP family ABC transporter substrate-binding protein [Coprothermobacterota bacterium]|nr:BMP family ABC transporter substrate-binding protein [Coprothermobacterota bacterium]